MSQNVIDITALGEIDGVGDKALKIAKTFPSYAALATAEPTLIAKLTGVTPEVAQNIKDWATVMNVSVQITIQKAHETASIDTDPFALLDTASTQATAVFYDVKQMVGFARTTSVLGPGLAHLPEKVQQATRKGMGFVTDPWVKRVLAQYEVIAQQSGGGIVQLEPNPKYGVMKPMMINILPVSIREEVVLAILDTWAQTPLDKALRAAKEYADLASKKSGVGAAGVNMVASAGDLSATADEVRADLIEAHNAVTILMNQGLLDSRAEMLAQELAYIILPTLSDQGFIHNNMGVPVQPGQNAFQQFLNASGPEGASMALAVNMRNASKKTTELDEATDFNTFLIELGKLGQEYSRAVTRFHRHAPKPQVQPQGFVGISTVAIDLQAMIKVSVDAGGTTITTTLSASTTHSFSPILPANKGDWSVLHHYINEDELQTACYDLLYPQSRNLDLRTVDDYLLHIPDSNKEILANRLLQQHSIVWPSQIKDALNKLNTTQIEEIAMEAGVDIRYIDFNSRGKAISGVISTAIRSGWINLASVALKRGLL